MALGCFSFPPLPQCTIIPAQLIPVNWNLIAQIHNLLKYSMHLVIRSFNSHGMYKHCNVYKKLTNAALVHWFLFCSQNPN